MSQEHLDEIAHQELEYMLAKLTARMSEMHPDLASALKAIQSGEVGDAEGMRLLFAAIGKHGLHKSIEQTAVDVFQPNLDVPVVFHPEGRLPRLNPLVEAAIAEQAQFDGDVPELRAGPLPPGATPAVPVQNPSRDPVALGVQLEQASEMVAREIAEVRQGHIRMIEAKAEEEGLNEDGRIALYQDLLPSLPMGVAGYQPGSLPVPRQVDAPSGSALAALTPQERQQKAWKALSTTQGRRSALQVIEELVLAGLRNDGFEMKARAPERGRVEIRAFAEWKIRLSGPEAMQSHFSFMDSAAKGLLRSLSEQLEDTNPEGLVLELTAINTADVRQVGWAARVVYTGRKPA